MTKGTPHALVTGGNRGIGLAVVEDLSRRGWTVLLGARELDAGRRAAANVDGRGEVIPVVIDVTDDASVKGAAAEIQSRFPRLRSLINNAGVAKDGFSPRVVEETMAVNVHGPARVTDALVDHVEDGGTVVMVSSGMGELDVYSPELRERFLDDRDGLPGVFALTDAFLAAVREGSHRERGWPQSAYRVSKAALNKLTRIYAREQPRLRINAVCPGWVRTAMGGPSATRAPEEGAASVVWAATLDETGPTGGFFRDGQRLAW